MATISSPADLHTREQPTARAFLDATLDPQFWARARGIRELTEPVRKLSGWAKGCDCHESELEQGKDIQCVWKGCRAPSIARRLRQFEAHVIALRSQANPGAVPGISSEDVASSLTQLLEFVRLKFQ